MFSSGEAQSKQTQVQLLGLVQGLRAILTLGLILMLGWIQSRRPHPGQLQPVAQAGHGQQAWQPPSATCEAVAHPCGRGPIADQPWPAPAPPHPGCPPTWRRACGGAMLMPSTGLTTRPYFRICSTSPLTVAKYRI